MDPAYMSQQHAGGITAKFRGPVHTERLRGAHVKNMHAIAMHCDCSTTFLRLGTARPFMGHIYALVWDSKRISPMVVVVGK
jgi:hypothetical protein